MPFFPVEIVRARTSFIAYIHSHFMNLIHMIESEFISFSLHVLAYLHNSLFFSLSLEMLPALSPSSRSSWSLLSLETTSLPPLPPPLATSSSKSIHPPTPFLVLHPHSSSGAIVSYLYLIGGFVQIFRFFFPIAFYFVDFLFVHFDLTKALETFSQWIWIIYIISALLVALLSAVCLPALSAQFYKF